MACTQLTLEVWNMMFDLCLELAQKDREPLFVSCTALAAQRLISEVCPDISSKKVTICGKSNIVGLPLALLLNKLNATVSLCHKMTPDIEEYTKMADIFITAIGKPRNFTGSWLKQGCIVIDIGINEVFEGQADGSQVRRIVGDVDFESAEKVCSYITPVPGGVGPMTIAMLMSNLVIAWKRQNS